MFDIVKRNLRYMNYIVFKSRKVYFIKKNDIPKEIVFPRMSRTISH